MVVEFSQVFIKDLKKHFSKTQAKNLILRLSKTSPSEGDFVALISNIIIREKREDSFRFYFITQNQVRHVITKSELDSFLLKFVALSKKNNQQQVIDKLKEDLKRFGYKL
jgi:hypothetical protein